MAGSSASWLTVSCLAAFFSVACSSAEPPGATVGTGGSSSSAAGASGSGSAQGGADTGAGGSGQGGSGLFEDGGDGGGGACQATSCVALGKNCGQVADGCGGLLDCGTCGDAAGCGLSVANVCTPFDTLCVPALPAAVCAGKACGLEGDGCGGTLSCGTCPLGQQCGLDQPFLCGALLLGSADSCPALITDCAEAGAECGPVGNGCGGTLECGSCEPGDICGLNAPQLCGAPPACLPTAPVEACANACGFVSDGCEGVISCDDEGYSCPAGQTCGGGGTRGRCGSGETACAPLDLATACAGVSCGVASDGCSGSHTCGSCAAGSACFSGQCQVLDTCTPQTEDVACSGKECGQVGDGCGGVIACGSCAAGQSCGLRTPFQCGSNVCQPLTQQQACAGKECGTALDGCGTGAGHTFACGSCAAGTFCGIAEPFQCDAPVEQPCVPTASSCAALGWQCGLAINNCGTVFDCANEGRSCNAFQTCSGGTNGTQATCVGTVPADCPLCNSVPSCSVASPTRLTGRVITPGRSDGDSGNQVGVPNAFVYILRENAVGDLPAIDTGIPANGTSCDRCSDQDLGPVLASAVTDGSGAFTLSGNIPIDTPFLLVTKVGKFRRAVTQQLPAAAACTSTALTTTLPGNPTRLPRSMSDAPAGLTAALALPHVAISTGQIDAMECVFLKMGIAQSEFGNFNSSARIHLYRGGASSGAQSGARIDNATPYDTDLYGSLARLQSYDMVVADCEGQAWDSSFAQRNANGAKLREFVNRGGRMFASHLSFSWLHQNGTTAFASGAPIATGLGNAATWSTTLYTDTAGTGVISVGRPRASQRIDNFSSWMVNEGVTSPPAFQFAVTDPRSMVTALGSSSEEFVFRTDGNQRVQQFSFNTPYAAPEEASCGRVAYSGFHVAATGGGNTPFATAQFPTHCTNALANNGVLTKQEKVLLYMLFDLGACVGQDPEPPSCTPAACPANACGSVPDGCGGQLTCGCTQGQACVNGLCVVPSCEPTSCEQQGAICSTISDGCGGTIDCACPICEPSTQQQACTGHACGTVSDGCSGVYSCGTCSSGCQPITACPAGKCGVISNGCNGSLDCGGCASGQVCGSGGPNVCGTPVCEPQTCPDVNAQCGTIGDGCGAAVSCGACPPGQACVTVNGVPNRCAGCQPRTCSAVGAECGLIGDGCGGTVDCGACAVAGEVCGAVSPNQCDPGPQCVPRTCSNAVSGGAECGTVGDGCGSTVVCGACPAGQLCGVNEAFKCGAPPACTAATCASLGAQCGQIGNGCGGVLDCGSCTSGATCGLGEANKCHVIR